ncbi:hypothetical protein MNBD_GAMMA20-1237 [hydrothermal vent metagenome]|uniref:Uncharacterized protein n=1 Tax=hydrothermal vent metagenome TaxID=652676 RepID=A0A3B1AQU9_9ZZZZ
MPQGVEYEVLGEWGLGEELFEG